MSENYLGEKIPKLGFGLMRLPKNDAGEMDLEQIKSMLDLFIERGFTYFDTAYSYVGSEEATKEALVRRYPRESYQLATKLPMMDVDSADGMERYFNASLERTGAGYFDFYLLHSVWGAQIEKADRFGAWDYVLEKKARGLIGHAGFSYHGTADVLDKLLERHPEMEFVQLQINYFDWESNKVQSRLCYETARKYNKPVIIMEPVKGGLLASTIPELTGLFHESNPDMSNASWALRFAASLDGVITVLSGMSNLEQVRDNTGFMADFKPLSQEEREVVLKAAEILRNIPRIPCTGCAYCVPDCPQKIAIPTIMNIYNDYMTYKTTTQGKHQYKYIAMRQGGKGSSCISCGSCEAHCPQHLNIIDIVRKTAEIFE